MLHKIRTKYEKLGIYQHPKSPTGMSLSDYAQQNDLMQDCILTFDGQSKIVQFIRDVNPSVEGMSIDEEVRAISTFICMENNRLYIKYMGIRNGRIKFLKQKFGKYASKYKLPPHELSILTDSLRRMLVRDVGDRLHVYQGNDIQMLYDEDNIQYSSCMSDYPDAINVYCQNPDIVRCLYIFDLTTGKYTFKALIWRITEDLWVMDHAYGDDSIIRNAVAAAVDRFDGIWVDGLHIIGRCYFERAVMAIDVSGVSEMPYMDSFGYLLYADWDAGIFYCSNARDEYTWVVGDEHYIPNTLFNDAETTDIDDLYECSHQHVTRKQFHASLDRFLAGEDVKMYHTEKHLQAVRSVKAMEEMEVV